MTVSVVTVTYNAASTVDQAVRSVLDQQGGFTLDYHIVDGGSTDGTLDILEAHKARIAAITSQPDAGLYDAMNRGVARAKGDIIGILNADDAYADPHVIADILKTFETTGADAVYADLDYVDEATATVVTRHWKSGEPGDFRKGWMPPHPTLFVKREIYEQHGLFSLELRSAADYELMLRFFHFRGRSSPTSRERPSRCALEDSPMPRSPTGSKQMPKTPKRGGSMEALPHRSCAWPSLAQNQAIPKALIPAGNAISGGCSSGPLGRSSRRGDGSP